MISRQELERLAGLQSDEGILSAYVKIDPQLAYDANQPAAKFKGALKLFSRRRKDQRWLDVADREKNRLMEFLEGHRPAADIVERAIEKAYLTGARVEAVLGEAREWLLARGGLGAVLRY